MQPSHKIALNQANAGERRFAEQMLIAQGNMSDSSSLSLARLDVGDCVDPGWLLLQLSPIVGVTSDSSIHSDGLFAERKLHSQPALAQYLRRSTIGARAYRMGPVSAERFALGESNCKDSPG